MGRGGGHHFFTCPLGLFVFSCCCLSCQICENKGLRARNNTNSPVKASMRTFTDWRPSGQASVGPFQSDTKLHSPSTGGDSAKAHRSSSRQANAAVTKVSTGSSSFTARFLSFPYACKRNTIESCFLMSFL